MMNKRIGELAEQAALLGPSSRIGNAHEATEKFAELIIRECADLFKLTFTDEQYQRRIDKTIYKHFGLYE
jgi:hypothetical protein